MDSANVKILLYVPEDAHELVTYLFREVPPVDVVLGEVLEADADALLVPLNSFGFFESGFPLRVADRFGFGIQEELRTRIREQHHGELLVGQAEIIPTGADRPAAVIAAPIARAAVADLRDTVNVYLAVRGVLLAVGAAPSLSITSIAMPLLGVDEGQHTPYAAARQVRYGVRAVFRDQPRRIQNLSKATRREKDLKRQERKQK